MKWVQNVYAYQNERSYRHNLTQDKAIAENKQSIYENRKAIVENKQVQDRRMWRIERRADEVAYLKIKKQIDMTLYITPKFARQLANEYTRDTLEFPKVSLIDIESAKILVKGYYWKILSFPSTIGMGDKLAQILAQFQWVEIRISGIRSVWSKIYKIFTKNWWKYNSAWSFYK